MVKFFDTHVHLDHPWIADQLDDVLAAAEKAGVAAMVNVGVDSDTCHSSVKLATGHQHIWACVGLHPTRASQWTPEYGKMLGELIKEPRVVAVGETGLDYYKDQAPRYIQKDVFRRQLQLACEHEMPVVIHTRDAVEETLKIVSEFTPLPGGGLMHSYPGQLAEAREFVRLGLLIALGGPVVYQPHSQEVAQWVPLDRLVLETDCPRPWIVEHPYGDQHNQPHFIRLVAEKIAQIKDISLEQVAEATWANACTFYNIETKGGEK